MHNLYFIWVWYCHMDCWGDPSKVLHFCLARHISDGLDGNTGRYHLGSVSFGVSSCGGGIAAAGSIGLRVPGETGTSSADRLLRLSLVLVVVCLDGAVNTAATPPGAMTHHVPGGGEKQ